MVDSSLLQAPKHPAAHSDAALDRATELCELRFLMVNGESFTLEVPAVLHVRGVKQMVIEERPQGPSKVEEIRLLHLGKFLDDSKTLKECNFATGADNRTTVHIAVKVATLSSEEIKEKVNKKGSACCAVM